MYFNCQETVFSFSSQFKCSKFNYYRDAWYAYKPKIANWMFHSAMFLPIVRVFNSTYVSAEWKWHSLHFLNFQLLNVDILPKGAKELIGISFTVSVFRKEFEKFRSVLENNTNFQLHCSFWLVKIYWITKHWVKNLIDITPFNQNKYIFSNVQNKHYTFCYLN